MGAPAVLDEILQRLSQLPEDERARVMQDAAAVTAGDCWVPNPGPQTEAYFTDADELFYGGQAGGGKTDLGIGLALTAHHRSLLLRRTNKEAEGLVVRMADILGHRNGLDGRTNSWRFEDGKIVEIGGCQLEEDKQKRKGNPHDLIVFDEVSDFTETQYTFIIAWNRSAMEGQRCRVVCAGNPPTRPEGLWVVKRWAAWLDPRHPKPAKAGELRYYLEDDDGIEREVDGPGPHTVGDKEVIARSRTFIPAQLSDNPDLARTNYGAVLDSLPKELRDAYRDGKFRLILEDGAFQTIPTQWVMEAIARWKPQPPVGVPMCAIGLDVAQGGKDNTVAAPRYDQWYDLKTVPGKDTPNGAKAAAFALSVRRDGAEIIVDMGGGYGGAAYEWLSNNQIRCVAYKGAKTNPHARTKDKQLKFSNVRSQAYWQFRESLDPSQPGGSIVALPDDAELIADLCAPTFEVGPNGIKVEPKEDVVKRLGRSPDKGDAVVMSHWGGPSATSVMNDPNYARDAAGNLYRKTPKVVMAYSNMRRVRR